MNKAELLKEIDKMIMEAKIEQSRAAQERDYISQSYALGKENGLLWAKIYIQNTGE